MRKQRYDVRVGVSSSPSAVLSSALLGCTMWALFVFWVLR